MENNKMLKNAKTYECKKCLFTCSKQSNYNTHLLTTKHRRKLQETKGNNGNTNHVDFLALTISDKFNDPTQTKTVTITSPIDTSYDTICAADLSAPINAYLELLAQPAIIIP